MRQASSNLVKLDFPTMVSAYSFHLIVHFKPIPFCSFYIWKNNIFTYVRCWLLYIKKCISRPAKRRRHKRKYGEITHVKNVFCLHRSHQLKFVVIFCMLMFPDYMIWFPFSNRWDGLSRIYLLPYKSSFNFKLILTPYSSVEV